MRLGLPEVCSVPSVPINFPGYLCLIGNASSYSKPYDYDCSRSGTNIIDKSPCQSMACTLTYMQFYQHVNMNMWYT